MTNPKKEKEKALDALRSQLKYSEEQLSIYKHMAASEEIRAEKILAAHEKLDREVMELTERLGEAVNKIALRDEGLVQTILHFAPHGDPPSAMTAAARRAGGS